MTTKRIEDLTGPERFALAFKDFGEPLPEMARYNYPALAGYSEPTTSREAAEGIEQAGRAEWLRTRVLEHYRAGHRSTADECAHALGEGILSIRPRVAELHARHLIEPTGERRKADGGRSSHVWRITCR